MTISEGALAGIKILDCTRLLPGGLCSMLMADLGADVLKIEQPGIGDPIRGYLPRCKDESYMYLILNRNKRSMTLNLKSDEGRDIFKKLVADADVVLEGNRPGVMDRLGLGYDALKAVNPRIVYCAITGYGQDGPYAQRAGHDLNYMGVAGALDLFKQEGKPLRPPGMTIADLGGGAQPAVIGVLAALLARERTGEGQFVDIAMSDGVIYWLTLFASWAYGTGMNPRGGEHMLLGQLPCYDVYPAKDGHLTVGCLEPHFWANLCNALDRPQYTDTQFDLDRRGAIREDLCAIFETRTRAEWVRFFEDKNVCIGPSYTIDEAAADPHNRAREMFLEMDHPTEGVIKQLGVPIKLSDTPGALRTPPPALGEHTDAVLESLGFDCDAIAGFRDSGAI